MTLKINTMFRRLKSLFVIYFITLITTTRILLQRFFCNFYFMYCVVYFTNVFCKYLNIFIYNYTHTHKHTRIYMCIHTCRYFCRYVCVQYNLLINLKTKKIKVS